MPAQLALFTRGAGRLFETKVLSQFLAEHEARPIARESERLNSLRNWTDALRQSRGSESELEARFLQVTWGNVLGYSLWPAAEDTPAAAWAKPSTAVTGLRGGTPDAVLGHFLVGEEPHIRAILELKSPGTDFDAPQSRSIRESPVEQAFRYARGIMGVRWVLVSDMLRIRLYSVESEVEFETFDLTRCASSPHEFRRLHRLLHRRQLVGADAEDASAVESLLSKSMAQRLEIQKGFYAAYYSIRADLYHAIRDACFTLTPAPSTDELLRATQRLLDRMLFLYYCEDHPEQLIPRETVKRITEAARLLPGVANDRVYEALKGLFREVDIGSSAASGLALSAYNGELFKPHSILDAISLPDALHDRGYVVTDPDGRGRVVRGVWGLHVYDFWSELNEHLLGHVFEESLSDLAELREGQEVALAEKLAERKRWGIYYTSSIITDFLSEGAVGTILAERAASEDGGRPVDQITSLRIVDLACGSGAFLVSSYMALLRQFWRAMEAEQFDAHGSGPRQRTFEELAAYDQAALLRESLFGVDLLPQAAEGLAKLALWLRSARKGERVADLGENVASGDSLRVNTTLSQLRGFPGQFDIVIGNPPWGGEVSEPALAELRSFLGVQDPARFDTWELFLMLGLRLLKPGGRLGLVLPDSILYPAKAATRQLLLSSGSLEKFHVLGPDWFGPQVRMSTVVVQLRKGEVPADHNIDAMLLSGPLRRQALRGDILLSQLEAQRSRQIPQSRCLQSPTYEIEVFRSRTDDELMERIDGASVELSSLCTRWRGEEINKAGVLWTCPSCLRTTTPGKKKKGGGFQNKGCPSCGQLLLHEEVSATALVVPYAVGDDAWPGFIDGDDINSRYQQLVPRNRLNPDVDGFPYKEPQLYEGSKVVIRQAGVGLTATIDSTDSRFPQSVYGYKLAPEARAAGYKLEFVLGVLLSRTTAYYIFKRFAEVDPSKAHAKLTHDRLAGLPVPIVDFGDHHERARHEDVVADVQRLLSGSASLGSEADLRIEQNLRHLWRISPEDGAYINREFADLPDSKVVHDLFPSGRPKATTRAPLTPTTR